MDVRNVRRTMVAHPYTPYPPEEELRGIEVDLTDVVSKTNDIGDVVKAAFDMRHVCQAYIIGALMSEAPVRHAYESHSRFSNTHVKVDVFLGTTGPGIQSGGHLSDCRRRCGVHGHQSPAGVAAAQSAGLVPAFHGLRRRVWCRPRHVVTGHLHRGPVARPVVGGLL